MVKRRPRMPCAGQLDHAGRHIESLDGQAVRCQQLDEAPAAAAAQIDGLSATAGEKREGAPVRGESVLAIEAVVVPDIGDLVVTLAGFMRSH